MLHGTRLSLFVGALRVLIPLFFMPLGRDAARSSVPYEKGFALLNELQRRVGVDAFHAFAKDYIKEFR